MLLDYDYLPIALHLRDRELYDAKSSSSCESYRISALKGPRLTTLMSAFENIALGLSQVPRVTVVADQSFLLESPERVAYHDMLQGQMGTFLKHGFASIPFLLEEVVRVGLAINKLADLATDVPLCYWETSSADGTVGRTLAGYSGGAILTLADSPNEANMLEFERLRSHRWSSFYLGSFVEVTPDKLKVIDPRFAKGFDVIWENTTFQMYGPEREQQIACIKQVLKRDGLAIFLEKLNQEDPNEYQRREQQKDGDFKARFFTSEQIKAKKADIITCMELGQVTLPHFISALRQHFRHAVLIWNSGNFYQVVASDSLENLQSFVALLDCAFVPEGFCYEKLPRWLFGG